MSPHPLLNHYLMVACISLTTVHRFHYLSWEVSKGSLTTLPSIIWAWGQLNVIKVDFSSHWFSVSAEFGDLSCKKYVCEGFSLLMMEVKWGQSAGEVFKEHVIKRLKDICFALSKLVVWLNSADRGFIDAKTGEGIISWVSFIWITYHSLLILSPDHREC
jgi:hypothetical protein